MSLNVTLPATPTWMSQANCQGTDPNEFYPEKGSNSELARKICKRCPVRLDCLEDALDRRERHGIWGGLSENQRTSLLRKRARRADGQQTTPSEVAA
ncbi:WhiB family transcriptional regulator [Micromonospora taraxaci]|uniref:WhiB family transcriptional regulator n=1 Tax=Micromonospora taraxaci TaxID=1316803 RepID=UPI0033B24A28